MITEDKVNRRKKCYMILTVLVLVLGLFIYFFFIHPIYIYDSDDWTYISYSRRIFPSIKQWNPTKVLPETLMPLVSEISIRVLYPLTDDYIGSLAAVFALTMVCLIGLFTVLLLKELRKKFKIKLSETILIGVVLVLSYWLCYNIADTNNRFLFYGGNANCYFNYIVPGIFNAIAVLLYLDDDFQTKKWDKEHWIRTGMVIVFLYLCINSNMFHSIILISFLGARLFLDFVKSVICQHEKGYFVQFIKRNIYEIVVVGCWLVSIFMESRGARAQWAAGTTLFNLPIKATLVCFIQSLKGLNKIWIVGTIVIIVAAVVTLILNRKNKNDMDIKYTKVIHELGISLIITFVYLILLCSKVSSSYISNNTVMISWMLLVIFITYFSLAYVLKKVCVLSVGLPFIVLFVTFNSFIDGHTFAENNVVWNYNINMVKALDDYYIEQIVAADVADLDYVEILAPVADSESWPLDYSYAGDRIAKSLFLHGVIKSEIHVVMVSDISVNEMFNLPTATMP